MFANYLATQIFAVLREFLILFECCKNDKLPSFQCVFYSRASTSAGIQPIQSVVELSVIKLMAASNHQDFQVTNLILKFEIYQAVWFVWRAAIWLQCYKLYVEHIDLVPGSLEHCNKTKLVKPNRLLIIDIRACCMAFDGDKSHLCCDVIKIFSMSIWPPL